MKTSYTRAASAYIKINEILQVLFARQRFVFVILDDLFDREMTYDGDLMTSFSQSFHHRMKELKM